MRIKLLIFLILAVFSTGVVFSVKVINNKTIAEVNVVAINEVAKTAEKNWGQISSGLFRDLE